ncbi:MAG: iron uptake system protein EfeO, partial [Geminicoccaceae bacterium]
MSGPATLPRRAMMLVTAASVLLVLLAGAAFYYASTVARNRSTAAGEVTVTIAGKVCEPDALSVPAGRRTFKIVNQSDRAVEWEILDGVMVVAERENIAPGISQTLTAKLVPGTYEITCGLLSNPRGTLTVTESAEAAAEAARPPLTSFIGPLAEYQLNLVLGADALVEATRALADAVKAGDLDRARQLYLPARIAYARIEPTAARFGDLATAIDGQADYFEKREQDPGFKGFHRLEYALFGDGDTSILTPTADALLGDVTELQARLAKLQPAPELPLEATSALLASVAQTRVPHG